MLGLVVVTSAHAVRVELEVKGIQKTEGSLWVALMSTEEAFARGEPTISKIIPVSKKEKLLVIESVEPGAQYALSVFHDVDNNGKLDKGIFGNPIEPYAFSNNARRTFSMPKFAEAVFTVPTNPAEKAVQRIILK